MEQAVSLLSLSSFPNTDFVGVVEWQFEVSIKRRTSDDSLRPAIGSLSSIVTFNAFVPTPSRNVCFLATRYRGWVARELQSELGSEL